MPSRFLRAASCAWLVLALVACVYQTKILLPGRRRASISGSLWSMVQGSGDRSVQVSQHAGFIIEEGPATPSGHHGEIFCDDAEGCNFASIHGGTTSFEPGTSGSFLMDDPASGRQQPLQIYFHIPSSWNRTWVPRARQSMFYAERFGEVWLFWSLHLAVKQCFLPPVNNKRFLALLQSFAQRVFLGMPV